ncbi:MAG TPA: hypothetical protein VGH28_33640 [Polyangiaceae bacterium]
MKRNRKMLLCVTGTSMAAIVGCATAQPVGSVGPPHEPATVDTAASPDAAEPAPEMPSVGTTAQVPDQTK